MYALHGHPRYFKFKRKYQQYGPCFQTIFRFLWLCPEVFCKKGVLRNLAKFTGKHLCQSLFFNKVAGPRPAILLKKRLSHRYFPVNFAKFLRTPFFIEHFWWLLLNIRFSSEMYFTNLDNAWSFWLALQQILFRWFPNAKLLSVYIPSDFTQFLLSVMEPLAFTGTVW